MESLSTQLDQFSSNTQWISHEIQRIRKEMDSLTPKSDFSPHVEQHSNLPIVIGSLATFILATLLLDVITRIALSIIFILALYEAITMSVESRPNERECVISSASISILCLVAIISIWSFTPSEILLLILPVISVRTLGNIIDRQNNDHLLPRPCPNLCIQKTWLGVISTIALPIMITSIVIWFQWLKPEYWGVAGIGLAAVMADLIIASTKRHYEFHYSSQAVHFSPGPNKRYTNILYRYLGDKRGCLDRFAPFIFSSVLLFFCLKL